MNNTRTNESFEGWPTSEHNKHPQQDFYSVVHSWSYFNAGSLSLGLVKRQVTKSSIFSHTKILANSYSIDAEKYYNKCLNFVKYVQTYSVLELKTRIQLYHTCIVI